MKMNKKGFTLIESIITFAILAIAGGMFLVGFYNVSVIASEGSIIKTETNTLYNSIVATDNDDISLYSDSMIFTFDDGTSTSFKCSTVSQEKMVGSSSDMFDIKFSKLISSNQLNEWVDNETPSDDEMVEATIRFRMRWPMASTQASFPSYIKVNINHNYDGGVTYQYYSDESIKIKKSATETYYNEKYVLSCLSRVATQSQIKSSISAYLNIKGDIIWYQIQKQADSSYDVIGFETPYGDYQNRTVLLGPNGGTLFDERDNWARGNLQSAFSKNGYQDAKAISIRDGKAYTPEEIYDNRNKYRFNIYMIEK